MALRHLCGMLRVHRMSRDTEKEFPELVAAVHKRTRPLSAISGTNAAQLLSAAPKGKVIDELEPGARLDLPFALAKSSEQKVYRYGMGLLATFDKGTDRKYALYGLW